LQISHGTERLSRLAVAASLLAGLSLAPAAALAHGAMEKPLSRIYMCYKEDPEKLKGSYDGVPAGSPPCIDLVKMSGTQPLYDWTEVNRFDADGNHKKVAPDGQLCSAGRDKYKGLDQRRSDWPTTRVSPDANGKYTFRFHATTPHAVKYFRFYVTRDGWKPTDELRWRDLELFATKKNVEAESDPKQSYGQYYNMTVKMPEGKTGRRLIFAVWQRSDSPEAFYSCSDVRIQSAKSATSSAEDAVTWDEAGRAVARNDLPAGSSVTFRVFDAKGGDVDQIKVTLTGETGAADLWPFALARKVNATTDAFRIGVEDDDEAIAPEKSAAGNRVFRSSKFDGYSYAIDVDTP
jgi:chitin-binding protein